MNMLVGVVCVRDCVSVAPSLVNFQLITDYTLRILWQELIITAFSDADKCEKQRFAC